MRPARLTTLFFALLVAATLPAIAAEPTVAPAIEIPFELPLADGANGNALLLAAPDANLWLVYATPEGKLQSYRLTPLNPQPDPGPDPHPGPRPDPRPGPTPPTPQPIQLAIIEHPTNTPADLRGVMSQPAWRKMLTAPNTFVGIIPTNATDGHTRQPSTALKPWIDRAAGHPLPWVIITDRAGALLHEEQLTTTPGQLETLIRKHGG